MEALLTSSEIIGNDSGTLRLFVDELKLVWGKQDLAPTFETLGKTLKLAKDLQSKTDGFKVDDLGDILTDLTNNSALKDVVNEVVTTETLKDLGLDNKTADMVSETVFSVINANYEEGSGNNLENEIAAVKEVYDVANKVINLEENQKAEITKDESAELVNALTNSTVLLDVVTRENSGVDNLNIKDNITEQSQQDLKDQIDLVEDEETRNKLKALFGF